MKLANHLDVANNEVRNALFETVAVTDPNANTFTGRMIYNATSQSIKWYDGTAWRSAISSVAPLTGVMTSIITVATSPGGLVTLSIADATGSFSGLLSSAKFTLLDQATANSTVSTLVARDASSNFAANFITANKVTGLSTPTVDSDAANKKYVDDTVSGLAWKDAVHVATTANLASLSTLLTIDGHLLTAGDRVLVKDQTSTGLGGTTSPENGIWVAAVGAWARALDADTQAELLGTSVLVQQGAIWQNTQWIMTTDAIPTLYVPGGTIATSSPIAFAQFGTGSSSITAGDGLVATGSVFNVVGTASRITVAADSIDISTAYTGQNTITVLGTVATGTWNAATIGAGFGGTGQTTYAIGDILYASAATTLSKLADVATGNVLISGGVTTAPAWGKVQLAGGSQHVTGTLAIGNGGTGGTAAATAGAVAYGASGVYAFTAAGTAGQVLISAGAGAPAFGAVSLASGSAGVTGTLAVVNGGTGSTTVSGVRTALATPTQVFGDVGNSSASIQITHSIGTKDVNVEVYETATGATVYCDVTRDTINTVVLAFSGTPAAAGTYRYVITGRTV